MLIGEVSKRAGVTKEAVRHYVDLDLLRPTPKQAGTRVYQDFSERDLERLKWVVVGKSLGFSLSEIEHYLTLFMDERLSREKAAQMFRDKLKDVDEKIGQLQVIKHRLEEKLKTTYS
ncbi:MerR family DNA-binding protein [Henriciella barbarensis]|nr:MerR family DNA-binding protein [Henriciella barbarensis]